jgi:CheY-like chemotaxis protein
VARPLIAILDDDLAHLQLLAEILASEGYAVVTEADLRAGYVFVQDRRPALVILDLVQDRQPVGLEVLRALRADPATRRVAMLVMSADTRILTAHAAWFRAEGIGVLDKPYDLDDLLGMVRHRLPASPVAAGL